MSKWRLCAAAGCCEAVPAPCLYCQPCWEWLPRRFQEQLVDAWIDREKEPARLEKFIEISRRRIVREKKAAGA